LVSYKYKDEDIGFFESMCYQTKKQIHFVYIQNLFTSSLPYQIQTLDTELC